MQGLRRDQIFRRRGRRPLRFTGIDPGADEIKMVQVDTAGGSPVVTAYGRYPAPAGAWTPPLDANALVEAVRQAAPAADAPVGEVITAISGDRVITRHVRVPVMPARELAAAVRFEAEKYLPAPLEQYTLRYLNLGVTASGGGEYLRLLLAAAPTAFIYDFYGIFARAGLPPAAIDLQALALWRVFNGMQTGAAPAGTVGLIDIGASATQLVVVRDRALQMIRTLPVGGGQLTRALAAEYGLDDTRACRLKESGGALLSTAQAATADAGARRLDASLREALGTLVSEIRRSLDYYATREGAPPVGRLLVSGGAGKLKGLREFLAGALALPVDFGAPGAPGLPESGPATGEFDPAFAVALGLALREVVA